MSDQLGVPGEASEPMIAGRYRVLDRLGSGAMADVYRAHDETLDRDVAVKVFRAVVDGADSAGTARQELELQALAQLSHPNLITLFDGSVADDGPSFLALELVEGPTLAELLRSGPLPEPQVRRIGEQIADALGYVHERGMVHRDVKPANILLGSDSGDDPSAVRARLSDFGIVRLVDSAQVTAADLTVGTAYYLAPEQARSAAVGPLADVYSLGLVLLEALTGSRPFEGALHEVLVARLTTDPAIPGGLPAPWPGLLLGMTAREPGDRPTAAEVARTLRAAAAPAAAALAAVPLGAGLGGEASPAASAPAAAGTPAYPTGAVPTAATAALGAGALGAAGAAGAGMDGADGTATPATGYPPTIVPPGRSAAVHRHRGSRRGDEAPERTHVTGMLIAAAAFIAIIAGAGWFLLKPASGAGPGGGPQLPAANHTNSSSRHSTAPARHHGARVVPVADESTNGAPGNSGPHGQGPAKRGKGHGARPHGQGPANGGPAGPKPPHSHPAPPTTPTGTSASSTSAAPTTSAPPSSPTTSATSPSSASASSSAAVSSAAASSGAPQASSSSPG